MQSTPVGTVTEQEAEARQFSKACGAKGALSACTVSRRDGFPRQLLAEFTPRPENPGARTAGAASRWGDGGGWLCAASEQG